MKEELGPSVWHGIPDLRDGSVDLMLWGELPVMMGHAATAMNVDFATITNMINAGTLQTKYVLGRRFIKLSAMPQTARCAYIEFVFKPNVVPHSKNVLYRSRTVSRALGVWRQTVRRWSLDGILVKETLPNGAVRYPLWGIPRDYKEPVMAEHERFKQEGLGKKRPED